jgi:hypothetical protein
MNKENVTCPIFLMRAIPRIRFDSILVADAEPLARSLLIDFPQQRVAASVALHRPAAPVIVAAVGAMKHSGLRCDSTCAFLALLFELGQPEPKDQRRPTNAMLFAFVG